VNPHAQRLAQGYGHDAIGLFTLDINFDFGTRILKLIQHTLSDGGFEVAIHGYDRHMNRQRSDQRALIASLRRQRPRAIVCSSVGLEAEALVELRRYQEEGGIAVCFQHPVADDLEQVVFDEEVTVYCAARHLLELGHRRIGLCHHGQPKPRHPQTKGFRRACRESGVPVRDAWIFHSGTYEENGARLAARFFDMTERPTAFYIANEQAASAFVNEVTRQGVRVPDDVSVISLGGTATARYCTVPLSTMACPYEEIARQVVELTLSRIDGRYVGPPRRVVFEGELVARQSTAAPGEGSRGL
jgi:DNA-binding LacI/PurR family transcriptional regulator